jgi:hypothetical protein
VIVGSVGTRRLAGALAVAGGVLLVVRVGLVLAGADGGLIKQVTTAGVLLCAGGCGMAGWALAERRSPSVRAGAAAVGVMLSGVGVLMLVALVGQLVAGAPAVLSELGTLAVAAVAIGSGAVAVGRRFGD